MREAQRQERCLILLRVSSEAQAGDDRAGLPSQRRECHRIAKAHGLEVVGELEFVESGATVQHLPEFQAMLERVREPGLHLVCTALDRFMRPEEFSTFALFDHLRDTDTRLYTSDGVDDLEVDALGPTVKAAIAAKERRSIRDRTMRGRALKRARGIRAEGGVGLPFGVEFDHGRGEWSYQFPQADQVREVYRLFLGGETNFREIARRSGVGRESNRSQQVRNILSQPLYKGIYRKDRTWKRVTDPGRAGGYRIQVTTLPPDLVQEWSAPGLQPPLIEPTDWEQAQILLAEIARTRPPMKPPEERGCDSPYIRRLWCAVCGSRMLAQRDSRSHWSHVCARARRHKCPTGSISMRRADPQLDAQLACLGDLDVLQAIAEESQRPDRTAPTPQDATTKRLAELGRQASRLRDGYQAGVIELDDLRDRLASIKDEAEDLRARTPRERPEEVDADELAAILDVFANWASLRANERRELLEAFGARVYVARPRQGHLEVERLELPAIAGLYKKMRRHGIT